MTSPTLSSRDPFLFFLFTDIAGSSALWERYPNLMSAVVEQQEQIIAAAVRLHSGLVFKTVGDQVCAVFSGGNQAIAAAVAAQSALVAHEWMDLGLASPLFVRMGLHSGRAVARDNDYFGPPLNKISRLLEIGHGGQILVTGTALDHLDESLPAEFATQDLGSRRFRDLPGNERIFQLSGPGIPQTFPPLTSQDVRPHNLPAASSPMVGRVEAASGIRTLLQDPDHRLVTLLGPGGMGKTRLALEAGRQTLDTFEGGVWFIDLAPVNDPGYAASVISRELRLRELPEYPVIETLTRYLQDKELLLILDNCEQLLPGLAPLVSHLLATAQGVSILATSREAISIRGERQFLLDPLTMPSPDQSSVPAAEQTESIELLIARVRDNGTDLSMTAENTKALRTIGRQLEGLPLAIELAAPEIALLGPVRFLERMPGRLIHLQSEALDRPARQRSLYDVVKPSADRLSKEERRLLHRLSVFVDGWSAEAAAAVDAAPETQADLDGTFDRLAGLSKRSLIIPEPDAPPAGRYRMLAPIREYAAEALAADDAIVISRQAHALFFAETAGTAAQYFHTADSGRWLDTLEADHANLLAMLEWLARASEGNLTPDPVVLNVVIQLWPFWDQRGYPREGRLRLEQALARSETATPQLRANAYKLLGNSYLYDPPIAASHFDASRSIAIGAGLEVEANRALFGSGQVALIRGDYDDATAIIDQYLLECERLEQPLGVILGHLWRGHIACDAGRLDESFAAVQTALRLSAQIGATDYNVWAKLTLGRVTRLRGDPAEAANLLQTALTEAETAGDRTLQAILQWEVALALLLSDTRTARTMLEQSLRFVREWDDERCIVSCLEVGVMLLTIEGSATAAIEVAAAAWTWRSFHHVPKERSEHASYDGYFKLAETKLSPADREIANRRGQTMSLQSGCDIVLRRSG